MHRGRRLGQYLEGQSCIRPEWLPPYAPDPNPMDKGWAWMMSRRLANYGPALLEELTEAAPQAHQVAQGHQHLLRGFVRATGLPIRL